MFKITVLIAAYSEEKTIKKAVLSVLDQTLKPYEVIVVNDGSTDRTEEILKELEKHPLVYVIHLKENTGRKARAQRVALPYIRGDLVATLDADSEWDKDFLLKATAHFYDNLVGGVAGYVISKKHNLLTAARELQYLIGHALYKAGMNVLNIVLVMPGCGSIMRRKFFNPTDDTITEDMDLTLSILEKGYRVVFEPEAIIYTEDPSTFKSYVKQIIRWFSGFMQVVRKRWRNFPRRVRAIVVMIMGEAIIFPLMLIISSLLLLAHNSLALYPLLIIALDFIPYIIAAVYGLVKLKRLDLIAALPVALILRIVDYFVWIYCFIKEMIFKKKEERWL